MFQILRLTFKAFVLSDQQAQDLFFMCLSCRCLTLDRKEYQKWLAIQEFMDQINDNFCYSFACYIILAVIQQNVNLKQNFISI